MLYSFATTISQLSFRVYFKKIHYTGLEKIPLDKPLLLIANHTNALIDPVIINAYFPQRMHFITRGDVFSRLTIPIFKLLNMYPIYRMHDGYAKLEKNKDTFEICFDVLKNKGNVLIFAEGDCERMKKLRRLKKGAARMAFQAYYDFDADVRIVPISINYTEHTSFGGDAMIHCHEPFAIQEFDAAYKKSKARAINAFNKKVFSAMQDNLVHLDNLEEEELLEATLPIVRNHLKNSFFPILDKKATNRSKEEQKASNYINQLDQLPEKEALNTFKTKVLSYQSLLKKYNIAGTAVGKSANLLVLFLLILLFPLFLIGVLVNGLPLLIGDIVAKKKVNEAIYVSTFRWAIMGFGYFFIWLIVAIIAILSWQWNGVLLAFFLPISAYLTVFYASFLKENIEQFRFWSLKKRQPNIANQLIKEDQAIYDLLG